MANKKRPYKILMRFEYPKTVEGYPIEIVPGIKTFYYKSEESGLYVVCEHYSGAILTTGFRKKDAVIEAEKKLSGMDAVALNRLVANTIRDKNNGIKLND